MTSPLLFVAFIVVWFLFNRFILPRLGVGT